MGSCTLVGDTVSYTHTHTHTTETFGFPVYSVIDVYDIIEYLEEDPANEENVTRIKNYLAVNGAK